MPGDYRLVIKGHDGNQIGVLDAYESLSYDKLQNRVGEAMLVANYGVSDATDTLLDELTEDIILEVQRHPDPTDASLDWYVDWMGFCEPPEETTSEVATERNTWRFRHINRLLEPNLVQPKRDGVAEYQDRTYSLNHDLYSGPPRNLMRQIVRRHCVEPEDTSRRIPSLYVETDEPETATAGQPGWVHPAGDFSSDLEAVNSSIVWQGQIGIGQEWGVVDIELQRSADGDTWVDELNWYFIYAMCKFDDTGGERLYIGYGNTGYTPYWSGIHRSGVGAWGGWGAARAINSWCQQVLALAVHNGRLYAGTGYGSYLSGTYQARGRIWRCAANDGTSWAEVHDGNPGGGATPYDKHLCVEGLISWNGYIYAGVSYRYRYTDGTGSWTAVRVRPQVMRSASGDLGSWVTVLDVYGTTATIEHPDGTTDHFERQHLDGACCFAEFGAYLYVGFGDRIYPHGRDGRIYRTSDGTTWEQVFGAANYDELEEEPQFSAPGVTCLHVWQGALWAGCGGPSHGDGQVWYTTDGTTWVLEFDQMGLESHTCHTLCGFEGNLYAGFGYSPYGAEGDNFMGGYGYVWRRTEDGWEPPNWAQEAGGNWPTVLETVQGLAESTLDTEGGTDFAIVPIDLGGNLQEFQFRSRSPWGADHRSTGTDPTIFGINRGNMADPTYQRLKGQRPTVVYALGVGQGDNRTVLEMKNPATELYSPWGRREGTVNIQGVDTRSELWQQARKVRQGDGPKEVFTFRILETPSTRYGAEWDVGDLVTAVYRGNTHHVKIMGATVRLGTNPAVEEIDTEILLLETE